jgi:hypothetical protein
MAKALANRANLLLRDEGKEAEAVALFTEALSYWPAPRFPAIHK